jgi:uncharacterized membrane protein
MCNPGSYRITLLLPSLELATEYESVRLGYPPKGFVNSSIESIGAYIVSFAVVTVAWAISMMTSDY